MKVLYLDHNASTPPKPEALLAAEAAAREAFGNPSSAHAVGRKARELLEDARERLARVLGVRATEIVFTSGGTEANRLAIEGALSSAQPGSRGTISIASAMEHSSVLAVHARAETLGVTRLRRVRALEGGRVDVSDLANALSEGGAIVSLQHANSETGVIQPIEEASRMIRDLAPSARPLLHVDAVQTFGKVNVLPSSSGADLVTISSHKIGGPKGAGALWVRAGAPFSPPWSGGPQERGFRPGTENLPAIVGFVRAAELTLRKPVEPFAHGASADGLTLGRRLRELLSSRLEGVTVNGDAAHSLPNTLNASFEGVSGELLLIGLDQAGVAVSMGSACASGSREPSHVLRAMGLSEERVRSAIRFSTGWSTRESEIEPAVELVRSVVGELRERASPRRGARRP